MQKVCFYISGLLHVLNRRHIRDVDNRIVIQFLLCRQTCRQVCVLSEPLCYAPSLFIRCFSCILVHFCYFLLGCEVEVAGYAVLDGRGGEGEVDVLRAVVAKLQ